MKGGKRINAGRKKGGINTPSLDMINDYHLRLLSLRCIIDNYEIKNVHQMLNRDFMLNANFIGSCIDLEIIKKDKLYFWNNDKIANLDLSKELQKTYYNKQINYQLKSKANSLKVNS